MRDDYIYYIDTDVHHSDDWVSGDHYNSRDYDNRDEFGSYRFLEIIPVYRKSTTVEGLHILTTCLSLLN